MAIVAVLNLQAGIVDDAADRDVRHFLTESGEASKLVKQGTAPEPDIGVVGKLVLVGAERQFRIRTMVVEIFIDDAVLQHASERQRETAWRPGETFRHHKIRGKDKHAAKREREHPIANARKRQLPTAGQARP